MPELTIERVADDLLATFPQAERKEKPNGWNIVIPDLPGSGVVIPHAGYHRMRASIELVRGTKMKVSISCGLTREVCGNDLISVFGDCRSVLVENRGMPKQAAYILGTSIQTTLAMANEMGRSMHHTLAGASRQHVDTETLNHFRHDCRQGHRGLSRPLAEIEAITDRLFANGKGKTEGSFLELIVWASEVATHHADPHLKAWLINGIGGSVLLAGHRPVQTIADSVREIPVRYLI